METVSYPLRIPEEIIVLAKLRAKEEYIDQSTALRQLLYMGAEEYILNLVEIGRISIGRAAELLKTSVQDIYRLAEKHGIRLGAVRGQQLRSADVVRKLMKSK